MQQHNQIEEDLRAQTFCQYVLDNACRYDDPRFRVNAKDLAAEDTNIQSILFSRFDLSEKTIEAFIALSQHYCDTTPNPEITSRTVVTVKVFGVEKSIASAVWWCLLVGRTYNNLDNNTTSLMLTCNKPPSYSTPFPVITSLNDLVANAVSTLSAVPGMSTSRARWFHWRGT